MYLAPLAAAGASRTGTISAEEFDREMAKAAQLLKSTRPTAVNLAWAVERMLKSIAGETPATTERQVEIARRMAEQIADEDAEQCRMIGEHGLKLIAQIARKKNGGPVNVLTHCNAGWLAFVDHGSALAPVYAAHDDGWAVHVLIDETPARHQRSTLLA